MSDDNYCLFSVFFDSYADCFSRNNVVNLDDGDRVIVGSGSGEPFDTLICGITFKATTRNHRLCAIVKKMDIDRCDLNLTVYAKPSAHGSPIVSIHVFVKVKKGEIVYSDILP